MFDMIDMFGMFGMFVNTYTLTHSYVREQRNNLSCIGVDLDNKSHSFISFVVPVHEKTPLVQRWLVPLWEWANHEVVGGICAATKQHKKALYSCD